VVSATQMVAYVLKGHDRGTLWVACRKGLKMSWALAPGGSRFHEFNPFTGLAK